jgi:hypothetical protein
MKTVNRADITESEVKEVLETESHHNHEIVVDDIGRYRWKENNNVTMCLESMNLNELISLLHALGYGKNSEVFRKLYRDMGYSLIGYWEIFYWDVNNPIAHEYKNKIRKYKISGVMLDEY